MFIAPQNAITHEATHYAHIFGNNQAEQSTKIKRALKNYLCYLGKKVVDRRKFDCFICEASNRATLLSWSELAKALPGDFAVGVHSSETRTRYLSAGMSVSD